MSIPLASKPREVLKVEHSRGGITLFLQLIIKGQDFHQQPSQA